MSDQQLFSDFELANFSLKVLSKGTIKTNLAGVNLTNANLNGANYDSMTTWLTAEYWSDATCSYGTSSNDPGNVTCGLKV